MKYEIGQEINFEKWSNIKGFEYLDGETGVVIGFDNDGRAIIGLKSNNKTILAD